MIYKRKYIFIFIGFIIVIITLLAKEMGHKQNQEIIALRKEIKDK